MDLVRFSGKMALNTKDFGKIVTRKAKANSTSKMVTSMMENGAMESVMALASTQILIMLNFKVIG